VIKLQEGRYVAAVGKETFDGQIQLSLATGRSFQPICRIPWKSLSVNAKTKR
jgi:hypothetical protein